MMKILCSPTSPYSSKVRMAARHLGLKYMEVNVDTNADPADLTGSNPLGKIPVLVHGKGKAVYDSRAIMQWLDRKSGGALYPEKPRKRTEAEVLEALADGICDCLLAIVYEGRMRPEEKRHEPIVERQWSKVARALAVLENDPPKLGKTLHGGHFAMAAMIGYLGLRFAGKWEADHPALIAWALKFADRFPHFAAMKPQVAG